MTVITVFCALYPIPSCRICFLLRLCRGFLIPKVGQAFGLWDKISARYQAQAIRLGESETAYIGLLSILGLVLLVLKSLQRQLRGRAMPLAMLAVAWVLVMYSFGGLHALLSLVSGVYLIRSTNRYSAVISTIVLLYVAFVLHRLSGKWPRKVRVGSVAGVALLALVEQVSWPRAFALQHSPSSAVLARVEDDRDLVSLLEAILPAQGMLFMLPALDFPESGAGAYNGYEHLRPFLYSSQLRYSFGSQKGRQKAQWQHEVAALPAAEMITRLESCGFAGVLLNRRGYSDGGRKVLAELAAAGRPFRFERGAANEWVFIRLHPSTPACQPALPQGN